MSEISLMNLENLGNDNNLYLDDIKIPQDILFPKELNTYLKGQIEFLTNSNDILEKTLSEKELQLKTSNEKINQLNKRITTYESFKNDINRNSSSMMGVKIVELSKRLREKTSELESLRTKYSKLQMNLEHALHEKQQEQEPEDIEEKKPPDVSEIQQLQEKITNLNNKLFEAKNANLQLKNDLKIANKILQQELGDSFVSIQNITSGNSNWRGRAQQIISLQQKNSELLDRLSNLSEKGYVDTQPNLQKNDRKLVIEQLTKELENEKHDLEENKKKLSGARARIKVLETETVTLKNKLNSAVEKNNHNTNLIKILTDQIKNVEENNTEAMKEKQVMWKTIETENKNLKMNLSKEKCVQENLRATVREKEEKIKQLLSNRPESAPKISMDVNRIQKLEAEVKRLLEFVEVQNERLNLERNLHSEAQINYRKERQKAAKLETKLSRIEMESNLHKSQSYSKFPSKISLADSENISVVSTENIRNNLELAEEHILALQSRLQILQKEKELDIQRFTTFINETTNMKN